MILYCSVYFDFIFLTIGRQNLLSSSIKAFFVVKLYCIYQNKVVTTLYLPAITLQMTF